MSKPDYNIEIGVDGADQILAIKPPVDNTFREQIFDILEGMQLMKEVVVRGGFFETQHLADGSDYSQLRVSSTALSVNGQRIMGIAQRSAEVLRSQGKTAEVSPYLVSTGGTRKLFDSGE